MSKNPFMNLEAIGGMFAPQPPSASQVMTGPSNATAPGLLTPGTIANLYNRPSTKSPAGPKGIHPGNWSTTYSASFPLEEINGGKGEVLIPTVVDGKFLTDDEAKDRFRKTGEHLGIFDTWQNADAYALALHKSQEAAGNFYGRSANLENKTK